MSSQVRGLLGVVCLARGDAAAALSHAETVLKDPNDPVAAVARYVAGEAHARAKNWTKTIEMMLPFRDHGPWQSLPDLSDRALLRLGQALMETNQWDPARQTLGWLTQRFPRSAAVDEALYTMGWAWQRQEQLDRAVEAYTQLARQSVSEWAARAQLQIGLCQAARKRHAEAAAALLAVPLTYDFPEWNAAALNEAGRAYADLGAPEKATETWQRVIREYPASSWAHAARQSLADLAKRESTGGEAR
jgi:TolA-binding protein